MKEKMISVSGKSFRPIVRMIKKAPITSTTFCQLTSPCMLGGM
jgi:hypothetical protein